MKRNRFLMLIWLLVALGLAAAVLLSGCASTGRGKDAEPEAKAPIQDPSSQDASSPSITAAAGPAVAQKTASAPPARTEPVAANRGASATPKVQPASSEPGQEAPEPLAVRLKQTLARLFPNGLAGSNWNRIVTVVIGIGLMALVWGFAFWLARLPARSKGAVRRAAPRPIRRPGEMAEAAA